MTTAQLILGRRSPSGRRAGASFAATVLARFSAWRERARMRRALGRLDEHLLRDIGVDRATAACEADKPFWKA